MVGERRIKLDFFDLVTNVDKKLKNLFCVQFLKGHLALTAKYLRIRAEYPNDMFSKSVQLIDSHFDKFLLPIFEMRNFV